MINYFFVIYLYYDESVNDNGKMAGLWYISVNLYTCVLIFVTIDLMIFTKYHTWINMAIIIVFTIIAYIIFVICAHHATLFNSVGTMAVAFGSGRFWMSVIFICGTNALIDYLVLGFDFIFLQTLGKLLQKLFSQRGPLNDEYNLPRCINDRINMYKTYEQQKVHNENEPYKIPQNTKDFPEDSPLDGYVRIENITRNNNTNKNLNNLNNINENIKNDIKNGNNSNLSRPLSSHFKRKFKSQLIRDSEDKKTKNKYLTFRNEFLDDDNKINKMFVKFERQISKNDLLIKWFTLIKEKGNKKIKFDKH
jgi:energy-coupling factor transporter transmembrane protein EcfT